MSGENVLPQGWETATIGDVASICTGKLDVNAGSEDGAYPFFTCAQEIHSIDHFAFDTEAVLLAGNGNFNVKWYRGKFNVYQRTYVIEPHGEFGRFLYHQIQHLLPVITKGNRGSTIRFIRLGDIRDCKIQFPPPSEQERIVAKIEELISDLDAGVAALERAKANLRRYRAAVLKAAVEGKLTEQWRADHPDTEPASELLTRILTERRQRWEADQLAKYEAKDKKPPKGWKDKYKEPAKPDVASLPKLPHDWCWATVEQLVARSEYGTSVKCSYEATGVPVLRIPNIAGGTVSLADVKFATRDVSADEADFLQPGDILMCRTNGSIGLIGKTALVTHEFESAHHFASYLLRFRCSETTIIPYWLHTFASSHQGRVFIESHAASSAGQHNVSLSMMHSMPVPLAPLSEQSAAISLVEQQLSLIDASETEITASLSRSDRLRQSILKRAFEGQLVPQDPHDEPATELLARIKVESDTTEPKQISRTARRRRAKAK